MYSVFFPLFASPGWAYRRLSLPSFYPIAYSMWLRLLAYRCRFRRRGLISSCCSVLRFLLACVPSRLAVSSHASHLIGYRLARPSPRFSTRLGGACGGERPVFSACLTSSCGLCRYLPMSIASSFRFHPLRCHLSACLLCRIGCVGDSVLISSCGMYCDVLLAHRLVSSLVSFVVSSVGSVSVSSLAPFLDTMGG